jgi:hypothetical protein
MGSRRKKRMTIELREQTRVLDVGPIEIWDGADLALIRDTLFRLIEKEGRRHVGVIMAHVKYIPCGFFGLLYDWQERGVAVRLYDPQPNVANMLWFRQFFDLRDDGSYLLRSEPKEEMVPPDPAEWGGQWDEADYEQRLANLQW